MNIALTDEQHLLQDTAAGLAREFRADPLEIDRQCASTSAWETASELGLLTMRLPEDAGGSGASAADVVVVAQALARAPAVMPFVGPVLASELVLCAGTEAGALAAAVADGRATIALDGQRLEVSCPRDAAAPPIAWDAGGAVRAVGVVAGGQGAGVVQRAVGADEPLPSADLTRVVHATRDAPGADMVGPVDAEALARWEAFALTVLSADLVGTMAGALDHAVSYARERHQFGKPIGAFQALAHMLSDAHVVTEAARSATSYAAWMLDAGGGREALIAARVAKAYAARAAVQVAETAMQVHGGMGTTWESPCHLYLRRAVADAAVLGDEERQLSRIATARLGDGPNGLR